MIIAGLFSLLSNIFFFSSYVSEKNSFPQKLEPDEEKTLLEQMWAGDAQARDLLIQHNMRLVAHIVKKYSSYNDSDELISIGSIGLIKAINTYSKDKGTQLATYSARCIENEILMTLRANKKLKANKSLYEPISFDKDGNEVTLIDLLSQDEESVMSQVENDIISEKLTKLVKENLSGREYEIICMRYGLNKTQTLTQKQIAKQYNISRSYVSRIETKALKTLREYMDSNNISF
ncbi:MAG: RNA polymerase sporulation sigma factor SigK [Clostridia bacterium]